MTQNDEFLVSRDELVQLFDSGRLEDDNKGWLYDKQPIEIVAIHETDPKYLKNITNAQYYKLVLKEK